MPQPRGLFWPLPSTPEMNSEALQTYLTALASSLTINVLVPLLILALVVGVMWSLLAKAQAREGFEISDVFVDEAGKVSSERLLMFLSWAASTWVLAVVIFALPQHVMEAYVTYLGVWGTTGTAKAFFRHKYGAVALPAGESSVVETSSKVSTTKAPEVAP